MSFDELKYKFQILAYPKVFLGKIKFNFRGLIIRFIPLFLLFFGVIMKTNGQMKYVLFDFEGLDVNQTNLPEGDYRYGDITYKISTNPFGFSEMTGNRVLNVSWTSSGGWGAFGRDFQGGNARFCDLNQTTDCLNFYIYNPLANSKNLNLDVIIRDDDNANNSFTSSDDDEWKATVLITRISNWQLITIPFSSFVDQNVGGNSIFDMSYSAGTTFLGVEFKPNNLLSTDGIQNYYFDMISFSKGVLPTGPTILDAPIKSPTDYCALGAFSDVSTVAYDMSKIPQLFEGKLSGPKKICIVNYFTEWSYDGSNLPNNYVNTTQANFLISNGYTPMITWEPQFTNLSFNNALQPNLTKILAGNYDSYINAFADNIKLISGTVLIRLFHEMNGDWYPWCIANNGANSTAHTNYKNAWKKIHNMFTSKGVTNVKWVWCTFAESYPANMSYNNVLNDYPGDQFVDIVGFDVYNDPTTATLPFWRSFRYDAAKMYHILNENFPSKPIYICEISSRERYSGHGIYGTENNTSEIKGEWISALNDELETNFSKVRALIWFDINKEHDWRINSSVSSLNSFQNVIWSNAYYSSCNLSLPVGFISYDAKYNVSQVDLNFVVEQNSSNAFVEVLRSPDGINFIALDSFIINNPGVNAFTFIDYFPLNGLSYYLLRLFKDNNLVETSLILNVNSGQTSSLFKVNSNPTQDILKINFLGNYDSGQLIISDITGREIFQAELKIENQSTLEISEILNTGVYFICLTTEDQRQCSTLLKK